MASPNGNLAQSDEEFEMIDNKFPSTKEVNSSMEKLSVNLKETTKDAKVENDSSEVSEIKQLREELERKDDVISSFKTVLLEMKAKELQDVLTIKEGENVTLKKKIEELELLRKNNERIEDHMRELEETLSFKKTEKNELEFKNEVIKRLESEIEELRMKSVEIIPCGAIRRIIRFRKVNGLFGAANCGNMVTSIEKDGPAGLAGLLEGDQIISINGINVETMSADSIRKLSLNVSDDVILLVRFNPERLNDYKIS